MRIRFVGGPQDGGEIEVTGHPAAYYFPRKLSTVSTPIYEFHKQPRHAYVMSKYDHATARHVFRYQGLL